MPHPQRSFLSLAAATLLLALAPHSLFPPPYAPALAQAQTVDARKAEADRLLQQGIEQYQTSQFEAALQSWQQALSLYRQIQDRQGEGNALGNLGLAYHALGNYPKAIAYQEQRLAIAREIQDRQGEGNALGNLGNAYFSLGNYPKAIAYQEQRLAIAREIKDRQGEGAALGNLGIAYFSLGNYPQAIAYQEQRLAIAREIKDRLGEGQSLGNLGNAYDALGNYPQAIAYQEQRLAIAREIKDRQGEGQSLGNLGLAYDALGNYPKAIAYQEQRLAIAREIKDRQGEGQSLGNLGNAYYALGNYPKAIAYQEQSLAIAREIKDRQGEGNALGNLGLAYDALGNYPKAIAYQEQRLAIAREIKDRQGEGQSLGNLGNAYFSLGNYPKAIAYQEQRLAIAREIKDRRGEGNALGNLGNAYYALGNYPKAIAYQEQRLAIAREIKDRRGEGQSLGNLGNAYYALGNYPQAIAYQEQRLAIAREIKDRRGEGNALGNLGIAYFSLGNYPQAIAYQEQRLAIAREIKDRLGEGNALGNLGNAYFSLGNYPQAIAYHEQRLAIAREIKDRQGEGTALGNLGVAYFSLGNYPKAIAYQEQHLAIAREIKDPDGERIALNNIAVVLEKQQQPELAILFYKESVNVVETIRTGLKPLSRQLQESYTQTVAGTYRALANLLLAQGRVLEAQQVLELLKIQELRDFTRDTRAGGATKGAPLNPVEAPVKPPFDTLIALGLKLTDCESQQPRCPEREQLLAQRAAATQQFNQQAERLRTLLRQQGSQDPAQLQQQELTVAAANIVKAQPKTVLIYPLVLEDKLWLVYGLQAGKEAVTFASREVPVTRKQLSETVTQFRSLLEDRHSDVKQLQQVSQKLYGWLVAPLRPQLDTNGIQNLVFSLDRSTRYMPLAALHDGQQYLAQRFTLSTILTAGLTNTTDKLSPNLSENPVLGLGLSNPVPGFNPLPHVPAEIDGIVRSQATDTRGIFQGSKYLNQTFTLNAFKNLIDYRILHIATHGKFVSEDPEQSFLLLGDGSPLKVPDIRNLSDLGSIHLAVLSACETAKGGQDKEGIEVAGLSYYFLTQNVKSVIASLWLVNDASTSLLMQQFYKHLATGKMTKAEALRQAQLEFLQAKLTAKDAPQRSDLIAAGAGRSEGRQPPANFAHPHYWAPFILIGNSL